MRPTLIAGLALMSLAAACSRATQQPIAQAGQSTDLDPVQCAALADSIGRLPLHARPLTQPVSRGSGSPAPQGNPTGNEVRIDFAVGTDGIVDPGSVKVEGAPPSMRTDVLSMVTGTRYRVVRKRGCAVPARGQVRLRTFTVRRER